MLKFLLKLLFSIAALQSIECKCRESFVTICDSFDDVAHYKDIGNVNTLMIGSESENTKPTSINLVQDVSYLSFSKLSTLWIVRAISQLESNNNTWCEADEIPLKYLKFYGNNLKNIETTQFPYLPLKLLSLVNNKIETLREGTFNRHKIESFDISDNLLKIIKSRSLPNTNVTKIITVRNNKVSFIEVDSFPSSLISLNLDENELRSIQDFVLENLVNLKELTLSKNKFTGIPNLDHLQKLIVFDISSNNIVSFKEETFKNLHNLYFLDLSNNKIASPRLLEWIIIPNGQSLLTVSLALNNLERLDFEKVVLQQQILVLHGNPWNCQWWSDSKEKIFKHQSSCDSKLLGNATSPYCVDGSPEKDYSGEENEPKRNDMEKSEMYPECALKASKHVWVYPLSFSCVL